MWMQVGTFWGPGPGGEGVDTATTGWYSLAHDELLRTVDSRHSVFADLSTNMVTLNTPPCLLCCHHHNAPSSSAAQHQAASSSSSSSDPTSLATSQRVQLGPVPGWQAELLSDALLGFGAQSVVVEEHRGEGQQEQERFGAEAELWDNCSLLVHFALEVRTTSTVLLNNRSV